MRSSRTRQLAALVALWSVLGCASTRASREQPSPAGDPRVEVRRDQFVAEGVPPLPLAFQLSLHSAAGNRIASAARGALGRFSEWFGPYPEPELQVSEIPQRTAAAVGAAAGPILVPRRWLLPDHDASLERVLITEVARRFWQVGGTPGGNESFREGLALYAASRAINELGLEQTVDLRPRHTERFFGGTIPYVVRSLVLPRPLRDPRPLIRQFAELQPSNEDAARTVLALHTFDRHFGWAPLQQALAAVFAEGAAAATAARLGVILSDQVGIDLTWYFTAPQRMWNELDYAVTSLSSQPAAAGGAFDTRVTVSRVGQPVFASRSLPVLITFGDGREMVEWWNGSEPALEVNVSSTSRAVRASVDPDATLLLDANRRNNTATLSAELPRYAGRLWMHWIVWLQDLVLTYTSCA